MNILKSISRTYKKQLVLLNKRRELYVISLLTVVSLGSICFLIFQVDDEGRLEISYPCPGDPRCEQEAEGEVMMRIQAGECTVAESEIAITSSEREMLNLINDYRQQNGLDKLGLSQGLSKAAAWLSVDMSKSKILSHTDSLGRNPSTRVNDCGYSNYSAENIAYNSNPSPSATFTGWKNSPGHNKNMLRSTAKSIGISEVRSGGISWWSTDFSDVAENWDGGTPSVSPEPSAGTTVTVSPMPSSSPSPSATPSASPSPSATPSASPTAAPDPNIIVTVDRGEGGNYSIGDKILTCYSTPPDTLIKLINVLPDGKETPVLLDISSGQHCLDGIAGPDPGQECFKVQVFDIDTGSVKSENKTCYNINSLDNENVAFYSFTIPGVGRNTRVGENPLPSIEDYREVEIGIFTSSENLIKSVKGYSILSSKYVYEGFKSLGNLPEGSYIIKIRTNNSLWKNAGSYSVSAGKKVNIKNSALVTGDIYQDNQLALNDYNILMGCYVNPACDNKAKSDLNIDSRIDEKDLNIFYSGLAKRNGD